jgi:transcriptional regulator with XRE-family HTH domain
VRERILEFLKKENKTSAQFAEEIGVQPSGISHILSGRNNPSLDFVIKMLETYSFLSSEWLLFGKGLMYKEQFTGTLFSDFEINQGRTNTEIKKESVKIVDIPQKEDLESDDLPDGGYKTAPAGIKKIICFYENNSFEEFNPRKD